MPSVIPGDVPAAVVPLAWLLGVWEGQGKLGAGEAGSQGFIQRAHFWALETPFIQYEARSWLADEDGKKLSPLTVETGFWTLEHKLDTGALGLGLAHGGLEHTLSTAEDVQKLRTDAGFPVQVSIAHSDGVCELYYGFVAGPRVDITTDAVMRGAHVGEYAGGRRLLGLVDGALMWRWDHLQSGELTARASASLRRVAGHRDAHHGRGAGEVTDG